MKVMFLFNSVVGTSVISLTLTYLMQVYAALRERNTLGLKMHAMSAETGKGPSFWRVCSLMAN